MQGFSSKRAVSIFLRGLDRSSVITLAGAASDILDTLVKRAGKEPFVDYGRRVHHAAAGKMLKRKTYSHYVDKTLGIIAHKHLAKDDPETVELDLEEKAFHSLLRAMTDYIALNGQDEPFVKAFLTWAWMNTDGQVEPLRVWWRLQLLREWSHEQARLVFPRGPRAHRSPGARAAWRASVAVGGSRIHRAHDRLHEPDAVGMGQAR